MASAARRRGWVLSRGALALIALLLIAPSAAEARTITVGSPMREAFPSSAIYFFPSVTVANTTLSDPAANVTSPVDGVVVSWRIAPQAAPDAYSLSVLRPAGGEAFAGVGTSVSQVASTTKTLTFPTNLPIKTGDTVGITSLKASANFKTASLPSAHQPYWSPAFSDDGVPRSPAGSVSNLEFGFNAEVQPAPRVVLVGSRSGPAGGGTTVTIAGSDFTNVSAVRFGSTPAASYVVDSESEITAVTPAAAGAGSVDVTVTTNAGTSPVAAGGRFAYENPPTPPPSSPSTPQAVTATCKVPKLTGKKLRAGRKALRRAGCKVGKVRGKRGKRARVLTQSRKAGAKVPVGTKVNVTLG